MVNYYKAIFYLLLPLQIAVAQSWSFAVLSDSFGDGSTYRNALRGIRDLDQTSFDTTDFAECLFVVGDIGSLKRRYRNFHSCFRLCPKMKAWFPVMGNHDPLRIIPHVRERVLSSQPVVWQYPGKTLSYYIDWHNARFVVVDQYAMQAYEGCIDSATAQWVNRTLADADGVDHVFIFFHEPAFPRYRHVGDSFDACPVQRDAFWNMLLTYQNKVRAVFCGHVHTYYRLKAAKANGASVSDPQSFPKEPGGIWQINTGASGQGEMCTFVHVHVAGKQVVFSAYEASEGRGKRFSKIDRWECRADDIR